MDASSPGQAAFGLGLTRKKEQLLSFLVGGGKYECCLWRLIVLASPGQFRRSMSVALVVKYSTSGAPLK